MRANQVARLLLDQVVVTPRASVDEYGQSVAGTSRTVQAKVVQRTMRARDAATGEDFVSTTQVATLHEVTVADTITIDGVAHAVRTVQRAQGTRGGEHVTVAVL